MTSEEKALALQKRHNLTGITFDLVAVLDQHAEEAKEEQRKELNQLIKSVAHIGVDFGYGEYVLEQVYIDLARKLYESNA